MYVYVCGIGAQKLSTFSSVQPVVEGGPNSFTANHHQNTVIFCSTVADFH